MPEAAAHIRRATDLPEQPRQAFGACSATAGQEGIELFGQVQQDGP